MNESTDIVRQSDSRIEVWGGRAEVREIARRVQMMTPGGKKLNESQALALAQGSVAHGLDPFNGEIWLIPDSGLMVGIKGLRKLARQQVKGNFWVEFEPMMDPDERNLLLIPEGALAFKAILRDSETLRIWAEMYSELADTGLPTDVIENAVGKRPFTLGIGYRKKDEKTKMDPVQVAMKRAEADAIKRRFDVPFATPQTAADENIIDAEFTYAGEEPDPEQVEDSKDLLYGEDETKEDGRPLAPEKLAQFIRKKAERKKGSRFSDKQQTFLILMLKECFPGAEDPDEMRHSVLAYFFGTDSIKKLNNGQKSALLDWINPQQDSGGAYLPGPYVEKEAAAVVRARMKDVGQQEMELEESE